MNGGRTRRNGRPRPHFRPGSGAVEGLERRDLLAITALGFPLPDLVVSGYTGPVAAYGGPLAVTITVANIGGGQTAQPTNLGPGAPSTADAGPFDVTVAISPTRRFGASAIDIGVVHFPGVPQGGLTRETATLGLPTHPNGYPSVGHNLYVEFIADKANALVQGNTATSTAVSATPVLIAPPLPDLQAIALDVPPVMQPGDTVQPNIKIANYGTVDTASQGNGPIVVDLVASTSKYFTSGSTVVATYTVNNLTPLSEAPTTNFVAGDANLDNPPNVTTLFGLPVTLPKAPGKYYLGVVVDPFNKIRQIHNIGRVPSHALQLATKVGPPNGLPPAGVLRSPAPGSNLFPTPPYGAINQTTQTVGNIESAGTVITTAGATTNSAASLINSAAALTAAGPPRTGAYRSLWAGFNGG